MNISPEEAIAVANTQTEAQANKAAPVQVQTVALRNVVVRNNPRSYFDQTEMASLTASVREQGILQPVLLRDIDGELVLVAGGRRYRAAVEVYGMGGTIPALVKVMTDQEAEAAALSENTQRANMSPTEESDQAAKVTALLDGNREEAAKRLGWSRSTLDKRMALQHCTEAVKSALNERKIMLGHAELLSATAENLQDKVLNQVITQNVTVEALRSMLTAKGKSLASACFDKTDCASCHHNSDRQMTLLDTNVGAGFCTNWTCFDDKTNQHVEAVVAELKEEVPNVRTIEAGDVRKVIPIRISGQGAVGEEQASNCKGCANYGATVSKIPGNEGQIERDRCFDPVCNVKMQAAYLQSQQPQSLPQPEAEPSKGSAKDAPKSPSAKVASAPAKSAPTKPAAPTAITNRVDEYRYTTWRTIAKKTIQSDPDTAQQVFYAMMLMGDAHLISSTLVTQNWEFVTGDANAPSSLREMLKSFKELSPEKRAMAGTAMAATIITGTQKSNVPVILDFLGIDMAQRWRLSDKYLQLLTKSEIEALAHEIGLKDFLGDKFTKLMNQKRDEIIAAFMKVEGFDFNGKVPAAMQYANVKTK